MSKQIPTPKGSAGWLWLACAVFAAYMFFGNGGNTRTEFTEAFSQAYNGQTSTAEVAQP